MPSFLLNPHDALPRTVLLTLGLVDLLRGILHTFFVNWSARTFARLDLSASKQDQLTLLGAFGISNFLTGILFLLISWRAPALSPDVLLAIVCSYAAGAIGMRVARVKRRSAFNGRYFMLAYLGVCLVTYLLSLGHSS